MYSYLDHLECTGCGAIHSHAQVIKTCPECGKVLLARYDLPRLRRDVDRGDVERRPATMWRFSELLPVLDPGNVLSLGEGGTPLLRAPSLGRALGVDNLYVKDEGLNPTGTFKARGLSAAVSRARELGVTRLIDTPGGNVAGAISAYAAKGGLEVSVFTPGDALEVNVTEARALGARVTIVDGTAADARRLGAEAAEREGMFHIATLQEPYRAEGKKTMGLEIAMQLGWRFPDTIVYPTGGGTGVVGMWKGFYELMELGWVQGPLPKIIAVQPGGCHPIVKAFHDGSDACEPWPDPTSIARGIRVSYPSAGYLVLRAIRDTGGTAIAVSDDEIRVAMKELALTEGLLACPEGAATLAGLKRLLADGILDSRETIVLLNTGSGYKYLDLLSG